MCNEDRCHAGFFIETPEPAPQLLAHLGIECAEGLIEQQHDRLDGECPGERHALALAARQFRRIAAHQSFDLHQFEQFMHPLGDIGLGRP